MLKLLENKAAYMRDYRARNSSKINAQRRARRANGRDLSSERQPHRVAVKRNQHMLKNRGISYSDFRALCISQLGKCAICGSDNRLLVADHNHVTGQFRAAVCKGCNSKLAWLENYSPQIHAVDVNF